MIVKELLSQKRITRNVKIVAKTGDVVYEGHANKMPSKVLERDTTGEMFLGTPTGGKSWDTILEIHLK